jgi:hypothetical protein
VKRNALIILFFSCCIANESFAGGGCSACAGASSTDWILAMVLSMERVDSISGRIIISIGEYVTAEDPTCGDIIAKITTNGCIETAHPDSVYQRNICMWLCGKKINCKGWGYCDWCGFWAHSFSTWDESYRLFGKGKFELFFKNRLVLSRTFDYGDIPGDGIPTFMSTRFLNKDFSQIISGDIFDAMEEVAISVRATFEGHASPFIIVKFISGLSQDTAGVRIPLSGVQGDNYIYNGFLPPGFFSGIVGDPSHIPPGGATITAIPRAIKCDGTIDPNVPVGQITVADYSLQVAEISFLNDFDLYKDDTTAAPPRAIPITDPVWVTSSGVNDPVAYRRDSTYNMSIVVTCNHFPMHDFAYKIRAVCEGNNYIARYSTGEYVSHFAYSNRDTIRNIRPAQDGQFPDFVGKDSLTFIWSVNKNFLYGIGNYRRLNITGPHRVYFTYEKPLIDTVNILGLDKICTYAEGLNIDTLIAESGVNGVYGEGWTYDPYHDIFNDPLDVIRQKIGICSDYANLLVYLYEAIGIQSRAVVIFDAAQVNSNLYYLWWYNSATHNDRANIYSNWLTSCDGQSDYWDFTYHAVAECVNNFCDASLGLFKPSSDYGSWWKYYVYPQALLLNPNDYLDAEPPPVKPYYYYRNIFIPSGQVYPTNLDIWNTYHIH